MCSIDTNTDIRAARIDELTWDHGTWLVVDLGFAEKNATCGVAVHEGTAHTRTFADLRALATDLARQSGPPLFLLLEAPLSVAFTPQGNPTARSIERRNGRTRPSSRVTPPSRTSAAAPHHALRR